MEIILISGAFVISFILVITTIPPILRVARAKKLYDSFDERKNSSGFHPFVGWRGHFYRIHCYHHFIDQRNNFVVFRYIALAVILLFFIGLKDVLIVIPARKKLVVQILAALLMITFGKYTDFQFPWNVWH
jgi:UDP-N-acetylmuramyl pentapeptide phosphotransferase/UDP-N-acetylglucosamine-1-phosphate transferase